MVGKGQNWLKRQEKAGNGWNGQIYLEKVGYGQNKLEKAGKEGMTGNERLWESGLMDEFDRVKKADIFMARIILEALVSDLQRRSVLLLEE